MNPEVLESNIDDLYDIANKILNEIGNYDQVIKGYIINSCIKSGNISAISEIRDTIATDIKDVKFWLSATNILIKYNVINEAFYTINFSRILFPKSLPVNSLYSKALLNHGFYEMAESSLLSMLQMPDFALARTILLSGHPPEIFGSSHDDLDVVKSFAGVMSAALKGKNWFPQAMLEMNTPLNQSPEQIEPEKIILHRSDAKTRYKVKLLSFSTNEFITNQEKLTKSAHDTNGFDEILFWKDTSFVNTEYYKNHSSIFKNIRGFGYYIWKPFIIYNELLKCDYGDYVVYSDCGKGNGSSINKNISPLITWCENHNNGLLAGLYYPLSKSNSKWTKRDCFHLMECDSYEYIEHCQVMGGRSVWKKTEFNMNLIVEWIKMCVDPRISTDYENTCGLQNYDDFIDHRHDQSIITNLVLKNKIKCFGTPDEQALDFDNLIDKSAALL